MITSHNGSEVLEIKKPIESLILILNTINIKHCELADEKSKLQYNMTI